VVLLDGQRWRIRRIFDPAEQPSTISDLPLRAYLALACLCGPLAREQFRPKLNAVDPLIVWAAAGPDVRDVLDRDDAGVLVCGQYGTRYPTAAAMN
jgi:hypothetical protein